MSPTILPIRHEPQFARHQTPPMDTLKDQTRLADGQPTIRLATLRHAGSRPRGPDASRVIVSPKRAPASWAQRCQATRMRRLGLLAGHRSPNYPQNPANWVQDLLISHFQRVGSRLVWNDPGWPPDRARRNARFLPKQAFPALSQSRWPSATARPGCWAQPRYKGRHTGCALLKRPNVCDPWPGVH